VKRIEYIFLATEDPIIHKINDEEALIFNDGKKTRHMESLH
jgi:hypothetical protein